MNLSKGRDTGRWWLRSRRWRGRTRSNDLHFARSAAEGRREPDDPSLFVINPAQPGAKLHLCLLRKLQGVLHLDAEDSGRCCRASCGPTGAAQRADWSADRSKTAWYGGWNGFRKRPDQDRFPRPRNPQSEHIVGCSNEATHERGFGRESHQTQDPTARSNRLKRSASTP
jgi:hypothetical protein